MTELPPDLHPAVGLVDPALDDAHAVDKATDTVATSGRALHSEAFEEPQQLDLGEAIRRGGFATLFVLTALRLVDGLEGQAFALLGPDIQRTLGLSDTALGAISGLGAAVYVLAALPIGHLADRLRRTRIGAACGVVAGAFALVTAVAGNVAVLALARAGVGAGKASTLPVHNSLLADAYPVAGRARVLAVHNLAAPLAAIVGPLAIGAAVGAGDRWRVAFVLVAVPLIVLALLCARVPEPERGAQERALLRTADDVGSDAEPLRISYPLAFARLKRIRTLNFLLLGVGVLGFVLVAVPTFVSVLLEDTYGLGVLARGTTLAVTELGSLAGVIVGGVLGERLLRTRPPSAILVLAGSVAAYGVLFSASLYLPSLVLVTAGITGANAVLYAGTVPIYAFVAAVVPPRLRSLGFALLGVYIFLLGGFLGGIVTGLLSDANGPRFALAVTTAPICLVAAGLAAYGARFVRADIAMVTRDLEDEDVERRRVAARGAGAPVVQVRSLDVSYGSAPVVFGVDLEVERGEILALVGTNGAGKSTVLRAMSGLAEATRGEVLLDGRAITYASPADRVDLGLVMMPGGDAVFPGLSVFENLLAGCHRFAWDRTEVRRRIASVLEYFPALDGLADRPAGRLSGGEQQMLGLAKAMLLEPRVLLVDELSLGLSPVAVRTIVDVIRRLRDDGVAVVVVEQSIDLALAIADRAVFLERGRVRFSGRSEDLRGRDDLLRAVFLGEGAGG